MTFFGKRVFIGIVKDLKIRKSWIYVDLKPMTGVLIKERQGDLGDTEMQKDKVRGGNWNICCHRPRNTFRPQK